MKPTAPLDLSRRRALVLLAAALPACSLTRPAPVKRTFLLEPPLPAPGPRTQPGTLRIGVVNVAAPFRDRGFVFRTGELKVESDFYHEFFASPSSMVAESAARAMSSARVFQRVVQGSVGAESADYILEGFVAALYADGRSAKAEAEVAINWFLSRAAFPGGVLWSREYTEREPIQGTTPDAVASAMNIALGRVLAALARDLAAADLPK
jgi:cholesterol transport system auxiliary component